MQSSADNSLNDDDVLMIHLFNRQKIDKTIATQSRYIILNNFQ